MRQRSCLPQVLRELLADVLTGAAMELRHAPDHEAQALAMHVLALPGPHREAWARLAPSTFPPGQREAARVLVAQLLAPPPQVEGDTTA